MSNGLFQKIGQALNFLGGVSGLLAISAVLVVGGEYKRQQQITVEDVNTLKPLIAKVAAHEDYDNERVANLRRELADVRESLRQLADLKVDLAKLSTKLDLLMERLDRLEKKP